MNGAKRPAELKALRDAIIDGRCPVLLDADEAAAALDVSMRAMEDRFENMVMWGDRWLVSAAQVRRELLAKRPAARPKPRICSVCDASLPPGAGRFCSPAHARMTPNARLQYRESASKKHEANTGVFGEAIPETGPAIERKPSKLVLEVSDA